MSDFDEWEPSERWKARQAERERADRFYIELGLEGHARTNPIVCRVAQLYIRGDIPLEEALAECVKGLVSEYHRMCELYEALARSRHQEDT